MGVKLRRRDLKSGKQSLYLDIYHEGQREYEFLKLYLEPGDRQGNKETLRLAESIRAKRQLELQAHRNGFTAGFKRDADFLAYFEKLKDEKSASDTAWRNCLVKLEAFTGKSPGDGFAFQQVTPEFLQRFQSFLLDEVSQITARGYEKKVVAALNQAVKDRIIPQNPADYIDRIPAKQAERTFLTVEELRRFARAEAARPEVQRAFLFSCNTGLRISDVRALRRKQVKDGRLHFVQQKTGGREYLPLNATAKDLLGERGEPSEKVFDLPAKSTINRHVRLIAEEAGIDKYLTYHCSRHTYAVLLLSNDVPIYTVSKLMGHDDVATTEIYANVLDNAKKDAVEGLPTL